MKKIAYLILGLLAATSVSVFGARTLILQGGLNDSEQFNNWQALADVFGSQINTGTALTATVAEVNQAADISANAEITTATDTLTTSQCGSTIFLNSATEYVTTLPAVTSGCTFKIVVKAAPSSASYTIVTPASAQIIFGHNVSSDGTAADTELTGGATTITFVDGQAGVGDFVEITSDGTNWYARCSSAVVAGCTLTG